MDNILEHPGTELQVLIKEKGLTQKAFSSILGKKVSEVNELLKGKRNITIQRDYLLHQTLGTPIKYWILKQIDYDYSLLDIEESSNSPLLLGEDQGEVSSHQASHSEQSEESSNHQTSHSEQSEESSNHQTSHSEQSEESSNHQTSHSEQSEESRINNLTSLDSSTSLRSSLNDNITQNENKPQETPVQEQENEDDEDFKNRANIFRSF